MSSTDELQRLITEHMEDAESGYADYELSDSDKKTLLEAARYTLESFLATREINELVTESRMLNMPGAAFVTIRTKDGNELRGCKGEILPTKPLIQAVQSTAISSAISDPRFVEVSASELPHLRLEISVLKPLKKVSVKEVEVGRHGLLITKGRNIGLLLPHVPLLYNFNKVQYLEQLCLKAGLHKNAWKDKDAVLHGFEAIVFEEPD